MTCEFKTCDRAVYARSLCSGHYSQSYKGKPLTPLRFSNVGKGCEFESCGRPAKTKGHCNYHYRQLMTGEELKPIGPIPWTADRVLEAAAPSGTCLLFGLHQVTKYPQVRYRGGNMSAHRLVYQDKHGDLPPRLPIHHKCGNSNCVNPEHLEAASAAENTLEMLGRKAYEAQIAALEARVKELETELEEVRSVPLR